jgi:hypothetical protein
MAFVFNPATGKFEQRRTPANQNDGKGKSGTTSAPARTTTATTTVPNQNNPNRAAGPPAPGQGYPLKKTVSTPQGPPAPGQGPVPAGTGSTSTLDDIYGQIGKVQDDAAFILNETGSSPDSAWFETRLLPINIAINERERLLKEASERAEKEAAARVSAARNAAERAAAEQERQRAIRAGQRAEADLKTEAARIKQEAIERIAGLYDPMQTRSQTELEQSLRDVSSAFSNAEAQIRGAGDVFAQSFQPGTAYEGVPFATYNVSDNPLLAALQQQGAGTGEVEAATNLARQSAEQSSSLEKWAASQLGTSQKNYEEAMRRASTGGVTAALQNLSARRPQVEEGIRSDYRKILDELARERATAETEAGSDYDAAIAAANKIKADTLTEYGQLPKKPKPEEKPKNKPNTGKAGGKGTTTPVVNPNKPKNTPKAGGKK